MVRAYSEFLADKMQLGGNNGFSPIEIPGFLHPFQSYLVDWAIRRGRAAIFADCGMGKALRFDEPILTPTGWIAISNLNPGDRVIGSDGNPHEVLGVYPQGIRELFAVRFTDGIEVICDSEHLWTVKTQLQRYHGRTGRTISTQQIIDEGLADGLNRKRHFIPLVNPIQYPNANLPIDPYTLGVLLGDGSFRELSISFTTADPEILSYLVLPDGVLARQKKNHGGRTPSYLLSVGREGCGHGKSNPLTDSIKSLGLMGHASFDKFIPEIYLRSSITQRRAILAGLLDTDGSVCDGTIEFVSTSRHLAEGVAELVQSLGGTAPIKMKQPYYTYKGELKPGRIAYRVNIRLRRDDNPFRLLRKRDAWQGRNRDEPPRAIASIRPVGSDHAVCIRVDSQDNLFVTRGHVLTHNTPCQLVWADNVVRHTNGRVLIVAPIAVGFQTVREASKFGISAIHSKTGLPPDSRIVVTNYERLHYFSPNDFTGFVADESSILKNVHGKTKAAVIEFMRTIPYRLLCTATAAPNDFPELGTSSEALGELGYQDMITKFFKQEYQGKHTAWGRLKYRLRGYAEHDFWRWVCSWARACRKPSDLGFDDNSFKLPELNIHEHSIIARTKRDGFLFDLPPRGFHEEREEARRTITERCEKAAELVAANPGHSLVWCYLNTEGDMLEKMIEGSVQVSGSDSEDAKERAVDWFTRPEGNSKRILISKPKMFGYGLNLQCSNHQVFFPSNSFEQFYQAVRRSWRFGQMKPVDVDIVVTEGEIGVMANLRRKAEQADAMLSKLVELMNNELHIDRTNHFTNHSEIPSWL